MELGGPWRSERRRSSLDPSRAKGEGMGKPCMRNWDLGDPHLSHHIPLPSPPLPWRHVWNHSDLIPQRENNTLFEHCQLASEAPSLQTPSPHNQGFLQRQHFTRGSAALPIIDLSHLSLALPMFVFEVPPQPPEYCWSPPGVEVN